MAPESAPAGRSPAQIADHNSRTVLEALRRSGPLTRNDLAGLVGLTIPGITNVTRRLLKSGLIVEERRKSATAQLPSAHYSLNADGAFAIGARVREQSVQAVLVDIGGTVRERIEMPTLAAAVKRLTKRVSVVGVGLATDTGEGTSDALVEQPTITASLAEATLGAGATDAGFVMVIIEETIKAGLFFHGRPFAGVHGRAGRIGEMRTGNDRKLLNEVASTTSFAATPAKDRDAWVANAARHLLDALFAMTGFVAPGRIFIASELQPAVVQQLIAEMRRLSAARKREADALDLPEISPATHGADSVLLGAALLPFFAKLLPRPTA